ncbi:hypothetical protein ACIQUB_01330 [Rhizobium sp. NPDC090275]|uniref:hypothetical protein n=1 Tax=Rhizobium sp. NPDC090275 TaxID=3364498 RepID=UPI000DDC940F
MLNSVTRIIALLATIVMASNAGHAAQIEFASLKPGAVQPATSSVAQDFDHICVLTPYQNTLTDDVPYRDRVNEHLAKIKYQGDEGDLAIVLVSAAKVEVLHFTRSDQFDMDGSMLASPRIAGLPTQFQPALCADRAHATFGKVERDSRAYIVLGKLAD